MRIKLLTEILVAVLLSVPIKTGLSIEQQAGEAFAGQNLQLKGAQLASYQPGTNLHVLVFEKGLSASIGTNRFSADSGVVWLKAFTSEHLGQTFVDYRAEIYLNGNLESEKGKGLSAVNLSRNILKKGKEAVIEFTVTGKVLVTADKKQTGDPTSLDIYKKAVVATGRAEPSKPEQEIQKQTQPEKTVEREEPEKGEPAEGEDEEIRFRYPVKFAPAGPQPLDMESVETGKDENAAVVRQRFYLWQKQDEQGGVLELSADNAVIYYAGEQQEGSLGGTQVRGVYLCGDVVITDGPRTIRAAEGYYDFEKNSGIVVKAEMRTYDEKRGMPIYVRAEKIRQVSENKFAAEDATVTTSEFHIPQISSTSDSVEVTDKTPDESGSDKIYEVDMRDVRLEMYDRTFFRWPRVRTDLQQSDLPIKSASIGSDSDWGTTLETQWYLSRILGLQSPEGVDSTLRVDYFSSRGPGTGVEIDYEREKYYGDITGYIMHDTGEDDLGNSSDRKNLEPPRNLRGHFRSQHRQYLPEDWQLTTEFSYSSDKHFYESFYRQDDLTNKERETVLHLKNIRDNRGLSILGKARINDFYDTTEEAPTIEYHLTGESFWDDRLTFYSDSTVSRFRQRYESPSNEPANFSDKFHTLFVTRNEVDAPLWFNHTKVVPYVAGTMGYEDDMGFRTDLGGQTESGEKEVFIGEVGVRASGAPISKVYQNVKSELWDLNKLRHVIQPTLNAAVFEASDSTAKQRDLFSLGLTQRLETKRGKGDHRRTVDWMRLDSEITWVNDSADESVGPNYMIWNKPYSPLYNPLSENVPKTDRRSSDTYGPRHNYLGLDYIWNISDTTTLMSDMNFDLQEGAVQQFNIGLSKLCWPDLRFYVGSRYLRNVEVTADGTTQKGSNDFTFAATYQIDPRYMLLFSQSYNFDYGKSVDNEIALIRRYHRVYYGLVYQADRSLDRSSITFSIWPQGIPEMGSGTTFSGLRSGQGY